MRELYQPTRVSYKQLLFDPNNYRFQDSPDFVYAEERRFHEISVQNRAFLRLKKEEGINVLKDSIISNGFIPAESLIVKPYSLFSETLYLVLEGNRRLAAVRWIIEDNEAGVNISQQLIESFEDIPVLLVTQTDDPAFFESLMGIRHVAGIKQWGGYQSAKLVAKLRDEYKLSANDVAKRIGLTVNEVNRRYRAYKALEQMRNNESYSAYVTAEFYPLFHEAIVQPEVRKWLGWDESKVQFTVEDELEKFYSLITPTNQEDEIDRPRKLSSREAVRELKSILPNEEARRILLDPNGTFFHALMVAKRQELSHSWLSKVAETISALESVGAIELTGLSKSDIAQIEKLRYTSNNLLNLYNKLTS